jgi:hypothetical protein
MAIGPSGGMLKKLFNPAMMKKKMKSAVQYSKSGGPGIDKNPPKKSTAFGKK